MRLCFISFVPATLLVTLGLAATNQGEQHAFAVAAGPGQGSGSQLKDAITPELSTFIEHLLESENVPGITLGVVRTVSDGGAPVVELGAWGRKTEEGDGHDAAPDVLLNIGSCSKAFLASAVGILMDDYATGRNVTPLPIGLERFDWDTKVADILPGEWALADPWANERANMRDILAHVSGMPRHDYSYGPDDTPEDVVERMRYLRPAYELRETWSYNNQMYLLGAHLVSTYSAIPYQTFVAERIFASLNMTATTFSPVQAAASGKLTQSWTKFGRRIPFWFTEDTANLKAGAGGVISSAEDMAKWLTVLLNAGVDPATGQTVIPRKTFDEITTAHNIVSGASDPRSPETSITGYGMGWLRYSYQGHDIVTHNGDIPGFSAQVAFLPADGLGLVILANADEKASANGALMYRILEDSLGLRRIDRPIVSIAADAPATAVLPAHEDYTHALDVDLAAYAGTYADPGYGALTLCASTSDSQYCTGVLSAFGALEPLGVPSDAPALYAAFPRIWSSHVRLTHRANGSFVVSLSALFPEGYGRNTTAFETVETGEGQGRAEFVVEGGNVTGFALVMDEAAAQSRVRAGCGQEDAADAWFAKIV